MSIVENNHHVLVAALFLERSVFLHHANSYQHVDTGATAWASQLCFWTNCAPHRRPVARVAELESRSKVARTALFQRMDRLQDIQTEYHYFIQAISFGRQTERGVSSGLRPTDEAGTIFLANTYIRLTQ